MSKASTITVLAGAAGLSALVAGCAAPQGQTQEACLAAQSTGQQRNLGNAGIGAAGGAIAGQVIGRDTAGTVLGALAGGAAGFGLSALTAQDCNSLPSVRDIRSQQVGQCVAERTNARTSSRDQERIGRQCAAEFDRASQSVAPPAPRYAPAPQAYAPRGQYAPQGGAYYAPPAVSPLAPLFGGAGQVPMFGGAPPQRLNVPNWQGGTTAIPGAPPTGGNTCVSGNQVFQIAPGYRCPTDSDFRGPFFGR